MAAQLFNDASQPGGMQESDIPDIFDVLEGGENDNAVKFLLGFGSDEVEQETPVQHNHLHHQGPIYKTFFHNRWRDKLRVCMNKIAPSKWDGTCAGCFGVN